MAPPVFKIPPAPPKKGATGERGTFIAFIKAHPALAQFKDAIWSQATNYGGITPTELAAVILTESGGNPNAKSKAGAKGLGQIWDKTAAPTNAAGVPFFRPGNLNISDADKADPVFAIKYAAWRLSGYISTHGGTIDQAWVGGYNPNYVAGRDGPANPISRYLPKGYVGIGGTTIDTSAGKTVAKSVVTQNLKASQFDKWAVLTAKGQIAFTSISDPANPPKNVLMYGGSPLTQSSYIQTWKQTYADTFQAYTGRQASGKQIAAILAQSPSIYTLSNQLATDPHSGFDKSPVWKQHAPGLVQYAKGILGQNWKPSGEIIRQAIAQNWDQATFYAHIKQLPAYEKGPEFQTNLAQNKSQAEAIYGKADPSGMALINHVTKQGWTPDEFASWLRSQPAYEQTPEHQSKQISFLTQLGLITGAVPTAYTGAPTKSSTGPGGVGAVTGDGMMVAGGA